MLPIFGSLILKLVARLQGGEKTSTVLRRYFSRKYKVNTGLYTYGSCFSSRFNIGGSVTIGKYCSFGDDVCYLGANHPIKHAVMSAYFYNRSFAHLEVNDVKRENLVVGNDVWIGKGAIIVSSCHSIGNGAVIAAGAVVTKDVPAYAIVAGVPARIIKYRFSEDVIKELEKSQWWNFSPEQLMIFYNNIDNPMVWARNIQNIRSLNNER